MDLSEQDKVILLTAARGAIKAVFNEDFPPAIDYSRYPNLRPNCGAFVTLRINNSLRGCIGYIIGRIPLFETVCEAAKQSAFSDPRFLPLASEELDLVNIEISVLTIPAQINSYDDIKLGIHGLLLEEGANKSVLLPQVASENNYSLEQFLSILCEKAGLYSQLWKLKMLSLKAFEAQIFSEEEIISKENE